MAWVWCSRRLLATCEHAASLQHDCCQSFCLMRIDACALIMPAWHARLSTVREMTGMLIRMLCVFVDYSSRSLLVGGCFGVTNTARSRHNCLPRHLALSAIWQIGSQFMAASLLGGGKTNDLVWQRDARQGLTFDCVADTSTTR